MELSRTDRASKQHARAPPVTVKRILLLGYIQHSLYEPYYEYL